MRAYNEMKSRVGGNPDAFMLNNGFFQVQNKMQESPDGWAQLYSIPGFLELQAKVCAMHICTQKYVLHTCIPAALHLFM